MRVSVVFAAVSLMAAAPVWAQSKAIAPRTTLPAHVMCADVLVPALPTSTLRIKGGHHPALRLTFARGDVVVVGRTPDDGLTVGQRYMVRRLPVGSQAYLPREGGYIPIRTPGWVTIMAMDEVNAMARIDYACDSVEADDFLEPFADLALPIVATTVAEPDFTERVEILAGLDGRQMFADGDTFSIARGSAHGVTAGARYAIYRDRKDGKPLVHIGEAIVTDPTATASKLLLMTTTDAVSTTDIAVPRR